MLLIILLLATKDVWALACKAAQVLRDVIGACIGRICLPFDHLLLVFLPLGIEDADLEVLSPLAFLNNKLAVGALLRAFRLLSLLLVRGVIRSFTNIVLHNFDIGVKC